MAYHIDYEKELNSAQLEAVTYGNGPLLVIAGAGSGKTRTLVYRLARLIEDGVDPAEILLLTFTRKAAAEMTRRAALLLAGGAGPEEYASPMLATSASCPSSACVASVNIRGGTFHAFAYSILRRFRPAGYEGDLSLMDAADIISALQLCREKLELGRGDRAFPKNQTIEGLLGKARNKEISVESVLRSEAPHLLAYQEDLARLAAEYAQFKRKHCLLDYDDLLFELESLFLGKPEVLDLQRGVFRHIMVDEYQDTNRVQARLARMLAGDEGNILAVGDDAQSIYAFRGADVQNILDFPKLFAGAKIITLEENYRSVQPVLDLTNSILASARKAYPKNLFTRQSGGRLPQLIKPISDMSQAHLACKLINELLERYKASEIAVLFRSGFHSFQLEVQLAKQGIAFRKYGGLRYSDAAHVKDLLSMARLVLNPLDMPSFGRVAELFKGVGPKTARKIYGAASGEAPGGLEKACAKFPELLAALRKIAELRAGRAQPRQTLEILLEIYLPLLKAQYVDDYPYREQALEELLRIAEPYDDLDLLISDLSLEEPDSEEEEAGDAVTLSTVHSAKGLEWAAVLVIDLVQNRFPSRHAVLRDDDYEEERRLLYVACTRAKSELFLFAPATLYHREHGGYEPVNLSPFLAELPEATYEQWLETYGGELRRQLSRPDPFAAQPGARRERMNLGEADDAPDFSDNPDSGEKRAFASMSDFPSRRAGLAPTRSRQAEEAPSSLSQGDQPGGENISSGISPVNLQGKSGYCRHKIFGRGKIIQHIPPDKVRVNFPGFGLKVIMAAFLTLED
ncbi:MAG: ATP-dependent helicase [Desulfovibrionaceae bacterium]|nr:ATP-dependent helicase [Desulfovibrionaceae bacterium]